MSIAHVARWLARASRYFRPTDLLLPTLPGAVTTALYFAYTRIAGHPLHEADVHAYAPAFAELMMEAARAIGRYYFRWSVRGVEHVPAHGGVLLVGNHNGALEPIDSLLTLCAVWDRFGASRPCYALTHDVLHALPHVHALGNKMGILRASHNRCSCIRARTWTPRGRSHSAIAWCSADAKGS
jgi:hypothetical protein